MVVLLKLIPLSSILDDRKASDELLFLEWQKEFLEWANLCKKHESTSLICFKESIEM